MILHRHATEAATAQLRSARRGDLAAVEQLLTENTLPTDGVRESFENFIVAEADGRIVGVAGLEICCEHALLRSVAVDPDYRSKGLGRALVTRVISDAEARGIAALYLLTTTAEEYFPTFGFSRISRDEVPADVLTTGEFQSACPSTATAMRRPVTPREPAGR